MTDSLLDIDYLRSFEVEPVYFGLGFIQLKILPTERVHFYHEDLAVLAEEPHDHRYRFCSHILQGRFIQSLFSFEDNPDGQYELIYEDCKPGHEMKGPEPRRGEIAGIFHGEYTVGNCYRIEANTLHTVYGIDNAITHITRDEPYKDFAGVVRKIGEEKVCPFSQPIPANQCWEMIEDMLPSKNKGNLGYHVRDIPKGVVGEPDKIVEEAYEILDAHEQGIRIMAELEMSDLYGALDRYRERYYPELTMKDIERMYRVTRRAFDNGKRT